jgi:hypothetical protein
MNNEEWIVHFNSDYQWLSANQHENFFNLKKYIIFALPNGVVAQMVEQRTENPCVTGSIPVDATKTTGKIVKWQNGKKTVLPFCFLSGTCLPYLFLLTHYQFAIIPFYYFTI